MSAGGGGALGRARSARARAGRVSHAADSRVLDLVVLLAALRAVADGEHAVVELRAAGRVHDAARVVLEDALVRLDGDGDGLRDDGRLEADLGVDGHVLVARDGGRHGLARRRARAVLGRVGVVRLARDALVLDDVLEGVVHQAAVAALVALGARAVDELLLRDRRQLARRDEGDALDGARRGEGPAAAALLLVLDGRHGACAGRAGRAAGQRRSSGEALCERGAGGKAACGERAHAQGARPRWAGARTLRGPVDRRRVGVRVQQAQVDVLGALLLRAVARGVERLELLRREVGELVYTHRPTVSLRIVANNLLYVVHVDRLTEVTLGRRIRLSV